MKSQGSKFTVNCNWSPSPVPDESSHFLHI